MSSDLRAALVAAVAMTVACGPGRPAPGATPVLRPIVIPALPGADEDAVRQLQAAHEEATTRAPGAAAYGRLGTLLMAAELNDAAEPALLNALALAPADPAWAYYLAHVYRRRGELANAAAYFERTLGLQPRNVAALWWLGTVYLEMGRPRNAEPRFSEALALQPGALSAVYGLGRAALARGDYAGAAAHFERVLAMNPAATAAHYPLGLAYRGLGRLQDAETHLAQRTPLEILPIDPLLDELETLLQSATAYQDRAMRAAQAGDWQAAADQFRRAVDLRPDDPDARVGLGMALAKSGDHAGAIEQAREAVRRAPGHPRAHALMEALTAGAR